MRRIAVLVSVLAMIGSPALAAPDAARQGELTYMLVQDCGSCHGLTLKGGLGSALRPETMAGRDTDDLATIILDGIPGTPMPPWRALLSPGDAVWLAQAIKDGRTITP